ncbi:hypothetical protein LMG28614_01915 [Paraburkholderia ultramafica]|uniref:Uncharacterized protein n=1 Tax=Paraburkholderia ultramafica TaxID=1544867 RepID=A0A6S7B135_9BURK|nr:hypothetical protein [Paraburkholderia ultramafica]CAB3784281.1 hypothetical protein LMG28614_01915 [Paraburkholderia ultramafica]
MKSRVINNFRATGPWPTRGFSRLSQTGVALGGAVCVLTLSGCYYPYGYYPSGYYPASYYSTVPSTAAQQDVPVGQAGSADAQQQQQARVQQDPPPTYAVAAPPVYVAPAYPAYYPPVYPAYYPPAYYGYPGYYGPSVAIGIGGYWGGGWGHHHWH